MHLAHSQLDFSILDPGAKDWGKVTETGLTFNTETPFDEWERVTKKCCELFESSGIVHARAMFLLGDALDFGEKMFGEDHAQVIDATRAQMRLASKTLQNAAWICRSVPPENRHMDTLSFAHHEVVAKLEPDEQKKYLDIAESDGLTMTELKAKVREDHGSAKSGKKAKKSSPGDGKEDVTEDDADAALETVLVYFAPLLEKRGKLTAEMRKRFAPQMAEVYKIAGKWRVR